MKLRYPFFAGLAILAALYLWGASAAGNGERLSNGNFEEGFGPNGVALAWNSFSSGNAFAGFFDDVWPPVVYDGAHSQLIEINSFETAVPTPPATNTATPTATGAGPTRTSTATPTATATIPTRTLTATPTATATVPTRTPTATPTATGTLATRTPTVTPTATGTGTGTPLATVEHPKGLVADAPGQHLFVASRDRNTVVVLDETTLAEIKTIAVGKQPFGIAAANNRLFVANYLSDSISVINISSLSTTTEIDVSACGRQPTHVAANTNTNRVYVTLHGNGKVAIIDAAANMLVACTKVGSGTFGIAVNPNFNLVYVGNRDSNDIWVIDGETNQAQLALTLESNGIKGSPYYMALEARTNRLFVAVGLPDPKVNRLFVYNSQRSGLSFIQQVQVGNTDDGGWILPSTCSDLIYIAATADNALWVLNNDLSVNQVLRNPDQIGTDPFSLTSNPALARIYIGNRTPGIVRFINEKCTTARLPLGRPALAPPAPRAGNALPVGTTGGIYQTVSLVKGAPYTFSMHGMMRVQPGDPDANQGNYLIQWAMDPNGGSDWTQIADWTTLPWNVQYPRLSLGPFLDYTTTLTAPSDKVTLFVRVLKKTDNIARELDVNLDGISLVGPVPPDQHAPAASLTVPTLPVVEHSYMVGVSASDEVGVTEISLYDDNVLVETRQFTVGPASQAIEFYWKPTRPNKHTLRVTARDVGGETTSASQEVNVGTMAEFMRNGDFESGFGPDGIATGWGSFNNGGAGTRYDYEDFSWPPVVLSGQHSQMIVLDTRSVDLAEADRYSGICQSVRGLTPAAQYWLTLNGMVRLNEGARLKDDWSYVVEWGYVPGASTDCRGWSAVTNWQPVPWTNFYYRLSPGPFTSFNSTLFAPSDALTLFVRVWKKWPTGGLELNVNLDDVRLQGYQ